eukprot:COSAG01_NODE_3526_length_5971_cov_13.245305_2_plen_68_part_00
MLQWRSGAVAGGGWALGTTAPIRPIHAPAFRLSQANQPWRVALRYFWDAATDLFGKVSSFGPGWLFY